jgi:hypothetical protein
MRKNGIVSLIARARSAIFGLNRSRRFLHPVDPSPALPYLDGLVLRPFSQHDPRHVDRLADRVGFDDFGSPDVIVFVQEKAAVNVHGATVISAPCHVIGADGT